MTEKRQARLVKVAAATVAIAVHGAFIALLLMPVVVRRPPRSEPAPEAVLLVSLAPFETEGSVQGRATPFDFGREETQSAPPALYLAPPEAAVIVPPDVAAPFSQGAVSPLPDEALSAIGRALACTYVSLDTLPSDRRVICEAMLGQPHDATGLYAYTADLAALRAKWVEELTRKLTPPGWTSLNSLTPFCRWDQTLCWLERYTTLGLERLDFLHGASVGRTFDLGRGWSAAFGATLKSVSFTRDISLLPERASNTEFIAGIAVAYRW